MHSLMHLDYSSGLRLALLSMSFSHDQHLEIFEIQKEMKGLPSLACVLSLENFGAGQLGRWDLALRPSLDREMGIEG